MLSACSAQPEELFASDTFRWTVSSTCHQVPSHIQANRTIFYRTKLEPLIFSLFHSLPSHPPHTSHLVQENSEECFYQFQALIELPQISHPTLSNNPCSRIPRISVRFLPTVIWKKSKTKKVQGLGAQP